MTVRQQILHVLREPTPGDASARRHRLLRRLRETATRLSFVFLTTGKSTPRAPRVSR